MLFSPGPGPVSSPAMRLHTNCPQGNKFNVTFCIFPFARLDAVEKHVKWMSILLSLGLHHDLSKHQRPRVEPGVSYIAEWSPWPDLQQLQWKLPTTILDLIISIPSVNSTTTGQRRRLWAQDAHHDNAAAHWHPRRQTPIGGEGRSTFVMGGGGGGRTGLPVSNLDKRPQLSAGFQLAGSSKAFCPSTAFFFRAPWDGDWLRAQMMRQERIPSPLQYSGWEEGGKKRGGSVGFRILSPPDPPFLRADSIPSCSATRD